ncbi:MAG: cytochrome P450 [Pseudomonadota bacterium]
MNAGLVEIADCPPVTPRPDDISDHDYIVILSSLGPVVHDRNGILITFTQESLSLSNDPALTRQIETETMDLLGITSGPVYDLFSGSMLFSNDQRHRARRTPMARTFAHRMMNAIRPEIRKRARDLIRPGLGKPRFDFLDNVASQLPARIIAMILGAPECDVPHFTKLVYSAIRALSIRSMSVMADAAKDLGELNAYCDDLLAARRAEPCGDFLSDYVARTKDADLTEHEIRTQIVTLILAGADTTRLAICSTVSQLLQHPEQWSVLRADPEAWVQAAAAEGLRYDPVIGAHLRAVTSDFAYRGVRIPAGTMLGPSVLAALRDPDVYAEPNRFNMERTDHPRLHPVFGAGAHRCLGEALARAELEECLVALTDLTTAPSLVGAPPQITGLGATRSIDQMMVRL